MAAFQVAWRDFPGARRVAGDRLGGRRGPHHPRAGLVAADRMRRPLRRCCRAERCCLSCSCWCRFFFGMVCGARRSSSPAASSPTGCPSPMRKCPGIDLDVQLMGGTHPLPVHLAARVWGSWPIPFLLIAALGLLWCAFWPWFRDRPDEMSRVNRGELKIIAAGRSSVSAADSASVAANARILERLVVVPDVWLDGILGQLSDNQTLPPS